MNRVYNKFLSALLVIALIANSAACATQGAAHVQSTNDVHTAEVELNRTYIVEFVNGTKSKIKGADLIVQDNRVGIRMEGAADYRYYAQNQIASIAEQNGSQWKRGMAIGAGAGAVAVGAAGAAFGGLAGCGAQDTDFPSGVCGGSSAMRFGLVGAGVGAVVGMGVGAAIGAAIPKKQQIMIAPQVSVREGQTTTGIGISGKF